MFLFIKSSFLDGGNPRKSLHEAQRSTAFPAFSQALIAALRPITSHCRDAASSKVLLNRSILVEFRWISLDFNLNTKKWIKHGPFKSKHQTWNHMEMLLTHWTCNCQQKNVESVECGPFEKKEICGI